MVMNDLLDELLSDLLIVQDPCSAGSPASMRPSSAMAFLAVEDIEMYPHHCELDARL